MSKRGFWDSYPQKFWMPEDWAGWEKAGRPRVPVGLRLSAEPRSPRLDTLPIVDPPGGLFNGFSLNPKPRPRGQSRRSQEIDALLAKHGIHAR